mmetsp:Transcript_1110/g.2839  ORF Transcript_1110/g.2839 Transcript_1110/m.2839 type:complete len:310 (+) Transcript_1110:1068-1997(+)
MAGGSRWIPPRRETSWGPPCLPESSPRCRATKRKSLAPHCVSSSSLHSRTPSLSSTTTSWATGWPFSRSLVPRPANFSTRLRWDRSGSTYRFLCLFPSSAGPPPRAPFWETITFTASRVSPSTRRSRPSCRGGIMSRAPTVPPSILLVGEVTSSAGSQAIRVPFGHVREQPAQHCHWVSRVALVPVREKIRLFRTPISATSSPILKRKPPWTKKTTTLKRLTLITHRTISFPSKPQNRNLPQKNARRPFLRSSPSRKSDASFLPFQLSTPHSVPSLLPEPHHHLPLSLESVKYYYRQCMTQLSVRYFAA